ncbi:MAG: iron-sulfur cluster assembly protein [Candidatus Omnitrophica bacterium]|nr:iron-sulfur cluster assembly protein [Candidatus Omnitrophota bacterium]
MEETRPDPSKTLEQLIWDRLHTCFDPEISEDIVELGLIYKCELSDVPGGKKVRIEMTLTSPGCPVGDMIKADIESKLKTLPGVREVQVDFVWDPPWDLSKVSESAKLKLGLM